jgi:hypothetical protein
MSTFYRLSAKAAARSYRPPAEVRTKAESRQSAIGIQHSAKAKPEATSCQYQTPPNTKARANHKISRKAECGKPSAGVLRTTDQNTENEGQPERLSEIDSRKTLYTGGKLRMMAV